MWRSPRSAGALDTTGKPWYKPPVRHGGEPLLLGKPFFRSLASFAQSPVFEHHIQTNLTLLDPEWIDILSPLVGPGGVGTSVDPFDDVRLLGKPGEYNRRWLRALWLLDDAGWSVGCVYVLHRGGLLRAQDLYWLFRNLRDNSTLSLRVNTLLRVGRGKYAAVDDLALDPGDYGDFLVALAWAWESDQRRLTVNPIKDFVETWLGRGRMRACDLAGAAGCVGAHLGVDPLGNVYNCGRAVDADGIGFGNLQDVSLADCLRHPARQRLRDREGKLLDRKCGRCSYWRLCHGGCLYESHTDSELTHQPTALCSDYQRFFHWLEDSIGPIRDPDVPTAGRADSITTTHRETRSPDVIVWNTPAKWADRVGPGRIVIRVRSVDDFNVAAQALETGKDVTLELPVSLLAPYRKTPETRRLPNIERLVVDGSHDRVEQASIALAVSTQGAIWLGPCALDDALRMVRSLSDAGARIVLDRLREWKHKTLGAIVDAFPGARGMEARIEPFHSTASSPASRWATLLVALAVL